MKYKEVYLTEKDSQVQALAPLLECIHTKNWKPAYNKENNKAIVPLQGHLMELLSPDQYDIAYKNWSEETTLCFPKEFKKKPKDRTIEMYNTAIKHLREAEKIIIATNFDNEGAALAMEVIEAAGVEDRVEYMLHMGSMNEEALREALKNKTPIPYREMADAGFARAYMDWAEGMSLSRALTIYLAKKRMILNFGGVKTPVINMVVERDLQFEQYSSIKYWSLSGKAKVKGKEFEFNVFRKTDEEGKETKIDNEKYADELIKKIMDNKKYIIENIEKKVMKENPKKLYTQTALQGDCSRKFNLEPIQTLAIAQKFYIDDKISTYPRTEIDAIHEKEYGDVPKIMNNLKEIMHTEIIESILKKTIIKRSTVFNSKKVTSHGAIIPTTGKLKNVYSNLKNVEKEIYNLIAERYIENFLPSYEYNNISGVVKLFDDYYISFTENIPLVAGYKILKDKNIEETIKNYEKILPEDIKKGDEIEIINVVKSEGETKPKPRFTNDTILEAMAKVANLYPEDKIIKEMLGEDGIGTGSTRAIILADLFKDKDAKGNDIEPWLIKKGKQIISTEKARKFIKVMPREIVSPIKRALLQSKLNKIERKELSITEFLKEAKNSLISDIEQIKEFSKNPENIIGLIKKEVISIGKCPVCKTGDIYENGKVYMCSGAVWSNEGTKEEPKWKNDGCDYKIFKNGLERFGKPTIGKLEIKKLLEDGKIKVKLKSKTNSEYEKEINIDEKFGIKVIF